MEKKINQFLKYLPIPRKAKNAFKEIVKELSDNLSGEDSIPQPLYINSVIGYDGNVYRSNNNAVQATVIFGPSESYGGARLIMSKDVAQSSVNVSAKSTSNPNNNLPCKVIIVESNMIAFMPDNWGSSIQGKITAFIVTIDNIDYSINFTINE